jgi:hypothetical protein
VVGLGEILESIKGLFSVALLALLVVFALPIALVLLSLATSSWIPIVLGLGVSIYVSVTLIRKNQRGVETGDDNKIFSSELQEKAIQYMLTAKEKKKEQTQT